MLEHVGMVVVVSMVAAAVTAALVVNVPVLGQGVASAVCRLLTLGDEGCGTTAAEVVAVESREPTAACVLAGRSDAVSAGIDVVVGMGLERAFGWEELSDETYRLTQTRTSETSAGLGVGGTLELTVVDTEMVNGAAAGVSGGVSFSGGSEWVVGSVEERDALLRAENWSRFDEVVSEVVESPSGEIVGLFRRAVGLGESFPPPDRVYVEGNAVFDGSAIAGASGVAVARGSVSGSRSLGYSYTTGDDPQHTYYFETTEGVDALLGVVDTPGMTGAELSGEATTLTAITVDDDGDVVTVSSSALAAGQSGGITNVLFGAEPTSSTLESTPIGSALQYEAVLEVRTDADRLAVAALLAGTGIDAGKIGATALPVSMGSRYRDVFLAAVRDRGELTRVAVEADDSTAFALSAAVKAGPVAGLSAGYGTSTMEYSDPEYFDGTDFAPRTNC